MCLRILNNRGLSFGTMVKATPEERMYRLSTDLKSELELSSPNIESSGSRSSATGFLPALGPISLGDGKVSLSPKSKFRTTMEEVSEKEVDLREAAAEKFRHAQVISFACLDNREHPLKSNG